MERTSKFNCRKAMGIGVLGALSATYLRDYLSERGRTTPIWEYRSNPSRPLEWDRAVRVISNPLMKLVADGIVSHSWDWVAIPDRDEYSQRWLQPPRDRWYENYEPKSLTILHHALAHTIFGIQDVYILGVDQDKLKKQGRKAEGYYYGFQAEGDERIIKNRILVPTNEEIRIL